MLMFFFFFFKQKTAYEIMPSLVGSEMCIRDSINAEYMGPLVDINWEAVHLMIYNIVLNAIRFTPDFGNVVIGARRSAFPQEKLNEKESLVIYVQDNGIGIPEKEINNVFKKFYELNEVLSHRSGVVEYRSSGLGLGLSTSARIVELHQGKIWIKSKENEGTTVYIVLSLIHI
eukprot:TRINITY_DN3294_c0_g1_i2.p2 TRINITY_DN3294_c0_g1~~TRINITY_DN3294_c0_g1_i2.p2  ORF type:complete len:173 (-),score=28.66 TRINITY_DN3294_c0_g1_i2:169-687(-)